MPKNEDAFMIGANVVSQSRLRWERAPAAGNTAEAELARPFAAAVADGVGGEASGEIASRLALKLLAGGSVPKFRYGARKINAIHERLKKYGIRHGSANMQTTVCAAVFENRGAYLINVGDSRLYRYRNGAVKQLSKDQSFVQMLYEQGGFTKAQLMHHSQKNVIFPVLGNLHAEPAVDVSPIEGGVLHGDLFLLCTDGLSGYLTAGELEEALGLPQKLAKRLTELVSIAKRNGSTDNITAVGISVLEGQRAGAL